MTKFEHTELLDFVIKSNIKANEYKNRWKNKNGIDQQNSTKENKRCVVIETVTLRGRTKLSKRKKIPSIQQKILQFQPSKNKTRIKVNNFFLDFVTNLFQFFFFFK